jgi:hypothetical protein
VVLRGRSGGMTVSVSVERTASIFSWGQCVESAGHTGKWGWEFLKYEAFYGR